MTVAEAPIRVEPLRLDAYFSLSVGRYPERIALERPSVSVHGADVVLTYRELDEAAEFLAARIRLFVKPDDVIMLAFPRTDVDVYVALLAVLKAGAAYCALDLSFPDERMRQLINDAQPRLLLTSEVQKARFQDLVEPSLRIVSPEDLRASKSIASSTEVGTTADLAYVIYTSGTTGRPKGVMIEHGQISNLIAANLRDFDFGPDDRILQGSSLSYDSSVEELFMAWAAGSTVVVGSDETVRLGPDLSAWLDERKITIFAPPPTLLRTMGGAQVAAGLSQLRFLYVGGEALTRDVVDAWAPGRILVNGYGPTECSVTVVRGRVRPQDDTITIGRPVYNHHALVLNEDLKPVMKGEQGELCIHGAGVARGYLNRPELTASKFPTIPGVGRVYRTGDLVAEQEDGTFVYHGRIDTQVKLRGYRLELSAIETHLCQVLGIKSAVCTVQTTHGKQNLVAFVTHERPTRFSEKALKQHLADILPTYMVPSRIVVLDELPKLTSGKVARKALPVLELLPGLDTDNRIEPVNEEERLLSLKMAASLGLNEQVCVEADFFEIGGDSLAAALLISDLRSLPGYESLTVRDVYLHRNVRALAQMVQEMARNPQVFDETSPPTNLRSPFWSTTVQALILLLSTLFSVSTLYLASFVALPWAVSHISMEWLLVIFWLLGPVLRWLWLPVSVLLTRIVKQILIGRYESGSFEVWSGSYVRHWLVRMTSKAIPWSLVSGTVIHNWVLRQLGATIGRNVYLHRGVVISNGGWDLVSIGEGTTIGRDVALRPIEYSRLEAHLGPVKIGENCLLETRSGVSHHGTVESNAEVAAHACVRTMETVPTQTKWTGSVGESGPKRIAASAESETREWSEVGYAWRSSLMSVFVSYFASLPTLGVLYMLLRAINPSSAEVNSWLFTDSFQGDEFLMMFAAGVCLYLPLSLFFQALVLRSLPSVPLGTHPIRSAPFMWAWIKESLVSKANRWLSGTLYWPYWLRLSGMKVGKDCEVSTIMEFVPEHVELQGRCFSADGIYFAVPRLSNGYVNYRRTVYEQEVFLGNHAVIEAGTNVKKGVLFGVCTVAPEKMPAGTSWFGTPTFELPNREIVVVDESLTHRPGAIRFANRLFWETLRFAMPGLGVIFLMSWLRFASPESNVLSIEAFLRGTFVSIGLALVSVSMVLILKWGLLGRVKSGQHGLWSCWCSRWDFVYVFWGVFARPILSAFEGTQLLNLILRCFGVSIGKRVFLGSGFAQVVDPDMLNFKDNSTVMTLFQAHSFEDRVLKIAPVFIEQDSSVGEGTVMLYGARIGAGSIVGEQSVVMKNERLSSATIFAGAPTKPMNQVVLPHKASQSHKELDSEARAV